MSEQRREQFLLVATSLAYLLIGLEVLFMITPFALYFYGVYGPILEWLSSSSATAWTTEFFLPHMVFVDDPWLNRLGSLQALFVIGLVLFFIAAAPLYYGRLTHKGVVSFGPYSRLRHPQYLFLAISGFGLLLYWPRFIVLIFYVSMLFVYYLLARNEEWRMKHEEPGSYEAYIEKTWMFLPGEPGAILFRVLFGWIRPKGLGLLACYLICLCGSVALAFGLRDYTLSKLPQNQAGEMRLISVYPRSVDEIDALYEIAVASPEVRALLEKKQLRLGYLMPGDFFLTGLILQEGPRFSEQLMERYPHLRDKPMQPHNGSLAKFFRLGYKFYRTIGTSRRVYDYERFVFVEVLEATGQQVRGTEVMKSGVKRLPVLVVDIDAETRELLYVSEVSGNNSWGRLPMPNF